MEERAAGIWAEIEKSVHLYVNYTGSSAPATTAAGSLYLHPGQAGQGVVELLPGRDRVGPPPAGELARDIVGRVPAINADSASAANWERISKGGGNAVWPPRG